MSLSECLEEIKTWVGAHHKTIGITLGCTFLTVTVGCKLKEQLDHLRRKRALKKWENAPKDVVIFHTLSRGKTVPNLSPFAMKLETYLRMAKIPYEVDTETPMGPVGKTPWITLNGEHIADSEVIIGVLKKKFGVVLGNYTAKEMAIGRTVRIMMDEYLYWGLALWRYVHSECKGLDEIFNLPPFALKMFYRYINQRVSVNAWAQGIGRHSKEQIFEMMKDVLQNASLILGDNKFLLGDKPCEQDCAFFGFLSMVMWAAPGSPYEKYLNDELPNLKQYCNRMKEDFWSNWNECLAGASE